MRKLLLLVQKELRLLLRDSHGLLLLFLMPCAFILIMSFALDSSFKSEQATLHYSISDKDSSEHSHLLINTLNDAFGPSATQSELSNTQLDLTIPDNFVARLMDDSIALQLNIDPATDQRNVEIFRAVLMRFLSETIIKETLSVQGENPKFTLDLSNSIQTDNGWPTASPSEKRPSSVQQNVPAWLLFAMFFITIPLSNTLIAERRQGTWQRLKTMGLNASILYCSKVIPYFIINLLQAVLMFSIGLFLIPALGGEKLMINGSLIALILLTAATSLAAISYALLIAALAKTSEQATISSGVFNLIMAALGGVMVPAFLMPETMQSLSQFSPMAWGLQGFIDILLRGADTPKVLPEITKLAALSASLLLALSWLHKRNHDT